MQPIELSKKLFNIRGQFYPKDHVIAMLPAASDTQAVHKSLRDNGIAAENIIVLSPEDVRRNLTGSAEESDRPMPSPGTEAETARKMVTLSDEGHWAVLIHSTRSEEDEGIVNALTQHNAVLAERYRMLVIEDLMQDVREVR